MTKYTCKRLIPKLVAAILFLGSCSGPEVPTKNKSVKALKPLAENRSSGSKKVSGVSIITTGTFHGDEVSGNVEKINWTGLFKGPNGYYLKQTKLRAMRVNDPVLDEEHQKTGWELRVPGKDTSILLISAAAGLSDTRVSHAPLSKTTLYPGDTLSIHYLGKDYLLVATGKKEPTSETGENYQVSDYKLYLSTRINGKKCQTLLSAHDWFDDAMVYLIFAGDLDRDGILDLILDDSYHYNMTEPSLYLSRNAAKGQAVKRVASHVSVGC